MILKATIIQMLSQLYLPGRSKKHGHLFPYSAVKASLPRMFCNMYRLQFCVYFS